MQRHSIDDRYADHYACCLTFLLTVELEKGGAADRCHSRFSFQKCSTHCDAHITGDAPGHELPHRRFASRGRHPVHGGWPLPDVSAPRGFSQVGGQTSPRWSPAMKKLFVPLVLIGTVFVGTAIAYSL